MIRAVVIAARRSIIFIVRFMSIVFEFNRLV